MTPVPPPYRVVRFVLAALSAGSDALPAQTLLPAESGRISRHALKSILA